MSPEILATVIGIIALAISGYAIYKASQNGTAITPEVLTATLKTSTTMATELTDVALTAAKAAEQLWRTGKLAKGERLTHAFNYVKQWFPNLDQARIITAIEAGVLVVNSIVDSIPAKPATPEYPTMTHTIGTPSFPDNVTGKAP